MYHSHTTHTLPNTTTTATHNASRPCPYTDAVVQWLAPYISLTSHSANTALAATAPGYQPVAPPTRTVRLYLVIRFVQLTVILTKCLVVLYTRCVCVCGACATSPVL